VSRRCVVNAASCTPTDRGGIDAQGAVGPWGRAGIVVAAAAAGVLALVRAIVNAKAEDPQIQPTPQKSTPRG
jgi:hypothetical protein